MKKTTKGALAAGAAAVLLAGGAGTYAAWTSTPSSTTGGTVQTGHLKVEQVGASAWTWATPGKNGAFIPGTGMNSESLAPGDSIKFTGTYKLDIKGTNLTADLVAVDPSTGTLPAGLSWSSDTANTLTGLNEDSNVDVTVGGTLTFANDATASMDEKINIGEIAVTLKQTAPAVAN